MRILLVGGGGREHALAWALHRHGHSLCFSHANPGFRHLGEIVAGEPVEIARTRSVDLVVIGPEAPLAAGLADRLHETDIPAFGPSAAAAQLESSKVFTKRFCDRWSLPTAAARVVRRGDSWRPGGPGVVKLDGLAAGKGVWVCENAEDTERALASALEMRPDAEVLVEERLTGPEVSVLVLSDGQNIAPLLPARDHKRRFDNDLGPNTGGMGAVAPVAVSDLDACHDAMRRAVRGMAEEGRPFRGVLYGGFMLTPAGPRLLEFNVRFGDPECQPLMMLLDEDPAPWFLGAALGRLPGEKIRWKKGSACCVVVCGERYPDGHADALIAGLPADSDDLVVFHSGTTHDGPGRIRATGGRVLGVTAHGDTLASARHRAYEGVAGVRFAGAAWRSDIGTT